MEKKLICLCILSSIVFCNSIYALSVTPFSKDGYEKMSELVAEVEVISIEPIEINVNGNKFKNHLATLSIINVVKGEVKGPVLVEYATHLDQDFNEANPGPKAPRVVGRLIDIEPSIGQKGTIYLEKLPNGRFRTMGGKEGFQASR